MQQSLRTMREKLYNLRMNPNQSEGTPKKIRTLERAIRKLEATLVATPSTPIVPRPDAAVGPRVTFGANVQTNGQNAVPGTVQRNNPHMLAGW
jgi:hypothetical protein